jgi:putative endonuclease
MKYLVYILKSESGKYYVGSTNDLDRRLKQHADHHTPSTHRLGKLNLVLFQEYKSLKDARSVEYKIKSLKRKDYIEKIIKDGYIKIQP